MTMPPLPPWGPPPRGYGYPPPPPPGPRRPRVYLIVLAAVMGLAFGGGGIWLMKATDRTGEEPPAATQFTGDGSISETFEAGEGRIIYTAPGQSTSGMDCSVSSADGRGAADIAEYRYYKSSDTYTRAGWSAGLEVRAREAGTYTVTCRGSKSDVYRLGVPYTQQSVARTALPLVAGSAVMLLLFAVTIRRARRRNRPRG